MKREFKYAKQSIDLSVSIIWGVLSIISLVGVILLLLNSAFDSISILLILESILFLACGIALTLMYISMYLGYRTYITIDENTLSKDQGVIRPKKEINLIEVKTARKIGDKLRLDLGDRNEIRIHLNCLTVEDIVIIEQKLNSLNIEL